MSDSRAFPIDEFAERLARLRAAMRSSSADVMLIDDCEALAYFTGYETTLNRYRACIVPADGPPVMVLRLLDAEPFRAAAWFERCEGFADADDAVEKVAAVLRAEGFGSAVIGFDSRSHALSVEGYERLRRALPRARFVPMPGLPWELRLIKSQAEIACLRTAAQILDQTVADAIERVRPGIVPRDVLAFAASRLLELGAEPAHLGYVSAARDWSFLHMQPAQSPLAHGDVLHLELVARYRGYEARVMRCVALGAIAAEREEAAAKLIALQDRQIAAMTPGALAGEIDAILRDGVLAAGLRKDYPNVTGYTLGYYSRVPIRSSDFTRCFTPDAQWRLEPGMVFHMYTSARGISVSETVLVGAHGAQRLTQLDRRLFFRK